MKRFVSAALVFVAMVIFVAPASAMELWDPHLRGVNEGLAAGLLPPKGLYFINNAVFAPDQHKYDNSGDQERTKLDAFIDVPILVWSTGVRVLGASYGVAIAQPFDYTNLTVPYGIPGVGDVNLGKSQGGLYNTVLVPAILSWALPHHFFVAGSLSFYANDGTTSPKKYPSTAPYYAQSSNGFWTIEPGVGISWLYKGWNLSADIRLDINLKNHDSDYLSGPQLWVDYTATKTIGKWTVGVGAYQQNQLARDRYNGHDVPHSVSTNFGLGPIVGYNFGWVSLTALYNFGVYARNDTGGDGLNIRLVIPLDL